MSIDRSPSASNDTASREVDRARPRDKLREQPREQPKAEDVDRFRGLMQNASGQKFSQQDLRLRADDPSQAMPLPGDQHSDQAATEQAVQGKGWEDGGNQDSDQSQRDGVVSETLRPAELAALYQAQVATREAPTALPPAAPQAHTNPQALADMLERHVRQLAVSPNASADEKGQVLLRLNDTTLPGTDLLLSRTETGWLLRADVRSRGSYDAIQQAAPKLTERFASRNLGELEVQPQYHG